VVSGSGPYLNLFSGGRMGPSESRRFSSMQIEQIRRTVMGRTPEVMVKVTGGGKKLGAVAAHFSYISQRGELEIETDRGERVTQDDQKLLILSWNLDLTAGQYRGPRGTKAFARPVKLVHNVVLSMPSPTPPEKVLAAAKVFAREKFGAQHRYAMVLHTHQQHPHVHLVVKAEREDGKGRLHIDKAMLREWRQDFAQEMRRQGIAANATSRSVRGQTKTAPKDVFYRTQARGQSYTLRERLDDVIHGLREGKHAPDPARGRLLETRKAIIQGWNAVADKLEGQGEVVLGGHVRYFAMHLPPALTDRERLTEQFMRYVRAERSARTKRDVRVRDRTIERTR
jgi:hypothetical protein